MISARCSCLRREICQGTRLLGLHADGSDRRARAFPDFRALTDKAALDGHMVTPEIKAIVPKLEPVSGKPSLQLSSTRERVASA